MQARMSRRAFLSGAAAMSTVGTAGIAAAVEGKSAQPAAGKLPARGEFVIRGAYVMTMDPTVGDIARGDVHVKAGAIVAVPLRCSLPPAADPRGKRRALARADESVPTARSARDRRCPGRTTVVPRR